MNLSPDVVSAGGGDFVLSITADQPLVAEGTMAVVGECGAWLQWCEGPTCGALVPAAAIATPGQLEVRLLREGSWETNALTLTVQ